MNALPPVIIQQHINIQQTDVINQKVMDNAYVLAATIWGEARGDGEIGMQAVLNVILNRGNGDLNNGVQIVLKPKQFSVWNNISNPQKYSNKLAESSRNNKLQDDIMYNKALLLVDKAIKHQLIDITGNATGYFNPKKVKPKWAKNMIKTVTIGNHDFYKLPPKKNRYVKRN